MKFNQFNWNLYKESEVGKKLIEDFTTIVDFDGFTELVVSLCPDAGINAEAFANVLDDIYAYKISEFDRKISSGNQLTTSDIWSELISTGYMAEDEIVIKPGDYRDMIQIVPYLSINLYLSFPDSFFPYLYFSKFAELKAILDLYEIEIPEIPSKKDYKGRCDYYLKLNDVLQQFREEIGLSSAEFCAFLYRFAPSQIEKEIIPSTFNRIWISGGVFDHSQIDKIYYWGNNAMARKGDLMFLYELSPVSAITSIWRLVSDGCSDPLFRWNAQAAVKHIVDIPAISLAELKNDSYFSQHPLVRRNMQGVNGTELSMADYANIMRLIVARGFDTSLLPKYDIAVDSDNDVDIKIEKEVEEKLLIPLLERFNIKNQRDFIRQLPIHAGRGHRIFPDFAVYYSDKPNEETAHILIEAKLYIRNEKELTDAFLQARSYANLLNSSVIILCDKKYLYVYKKNRSAWDASRYKQYGWSDLANADIYSEVARIFDMKQYIEEYGNK